MIVSDVMTRNPIFTTPEAKVTDALAVMRKEKINKLPVLDKDGILVGMLTKNDLAQAAPSSATTLDVYEIGYLLSKLSVEKIMTKSPETVQADEVIEEAARIMADKGIGCLPVMKDGLLVGIVTESDLFRKFIEMFGARHHGVRAMIEVDEKTGELAKVATIIAGCGGNIVSTVTSEGSSTATRCVTCKVVHTTLAQMKAELEKGGVKILDIREI
ncbi:MAG: CBS domain-containing protein [Treponema sp.]|nr:CBS domain-containing protein [Treponema sp.]